MRWLAAVAVLTFLPGCLEPTPADEAAGGWTCEGGRSAEGPVVFPMPEGGERREVVQVEAPGRDGSGWVDYLYVLAEVDVLQGRFVFSASGPAGDVPVHQVGEARWMAFLPNPVPGEYELVMQALEPSVANAYRFTIHQQTGSVDDYRCSDLWP